MATVEQVRDGIMMTIRRTNRQKPHYDSGQRGRALSKIKGEHEACKSLVDRLASAGLSSVYIAAAEDIPVRHSRRGEASVFNPLSKGTKGVVSIK